MAILEGHLATINKEPSGAATSMREQEISGPPKKDQKPPPDPSAIEHRIGHAVRARRQFLALSQEEFAWRAGVHRTLVAKVERGLANLSLRSIAKLATAVGLSAEAMMGFAHPGSAAPGTQARADAQGGEIILVDDDWVDVMSTLHALSDARCTNPVRVFGNGRKALDYLLEENQRDNQVAEGPLLVLLDLGLPAPSGLDILHRLKERTRTRRIPVVVLSGPQDDRSLIECGRLGVHLHLKKPVCAQAFISVTRDLHWGLIQSRGDHG